MADLRRGRRDVLREDPRDNLRCECPRSPHAFVHLVQKDDFFRERERGMKSFRLVNGMYCILRASLIVQEYPCHDGANKRALFFNNLARNASVYFSIYKQPRHERDMQTRISLRILCLRENVFPDNKNHYFLL